MLKIAVEEVQGLGAHPQPSLGIYRPITRGDVDWCPHFKNTVLSKWQGRGVHLLGALFPDEVPRNSQGVLVDGDHLRGLQDVERLPSHVPAAAKTGFSNM